MIQTNSGKFEEATVAVVVVARKSDQRCNEAVKLILFQNWPATKTNLQFSESNRFTRKCFRLEYSFFPVFEYYHISPMKFEQIDTMIMMIKTGIGVETDSVSD